MNIIDQLVDAAYDTGYYSGKKEDGQPHHSKAIFLREQLRHRVLDCLRGQEKEITKLHARITTLERQVFLP